ncbi:alpha/beta-hydrolase [Plenodomus tracheiphilus IPT5]|uniref:Alpha/beta-hydrolase n=1 Tax=Plenodomus tracheiphilus IPT5 TaxID=1408161 RepID=A0A6A7ATL7_9PLEO|nr:alpha/beta-hydrolase [Plenodomus tracheiphilus IPT5]
MSSSPPPTYTHTTTTLPSGSIVHTWLPSPPSSTTTTTNTHTTIILQHGYAEYASRYLTSHHAIISHFLTQNYTVHALDLWGHGESPGTRGVVHLGRAVQDHIALRRLVRKQQEPGRQSRTMLFGHSLGGLVTAGSVVGDAEGVDGVVLTGPAFPEEIPWLGRWVVGLVARVVPKVCVPRKAVPVEGLTRVSDEIEKYWSDDGFHKHGICFLLAVTALDVMKTIKEGLPNWTVPTIVLHGNADPYCDWNASRKFVESIASKDKVFQIYEEGRHELLHDLEGSTVLKQMLEWIRDHVKPSQSQEEDMKVQAV